MFAQIPVPPANSNDWLNLIKTIVEGIIAVMVAWTTIQSQKTAKQVATIAPVVAAIEPVVKATAIKLEVVHQLTNGNLGEQLRIGMIAAQTLALASNDPAHKALAIVAEQKYNLHLAELAKSATASLASIVDAGTKS